MAFVASLTRVPSDDSRVPGLKLSAPKLHSLELGQGMARLGSQTELIVRGDRPLAQEESDVSVVQFDAFKQDGIKLHFNTTNLQVGRTQVLHHKR